MGFSPKQEQKLKFYLLCALAPIGLIVYFYKGESLLNAVSLFLVFGVVEKIANLGYHRWLSHNMFEVGWLGSTILLWSMVASGLARPASYVAGHRMHHKHSDTERDPHHTKLGFWNSLVGNFNTKTFETSTRDIFKKKHIFFVQKNYFLLMILNLIFFGLSTKTLYILVFHF